VLRFFRSALYNKSGLPVKVKFGTNSLLGTFVNIIKYKEHFFFAEKRPRIKQNSADKKEIVIAVSTRQLF
jgi:hypothetical protein